MVVISICLFQAALNRTELMFDGVKYMEAQEQPITLQNTGTDLFEFELVTTNHFTLVVNNYLTWVFILLSIYPVIVQHATIIVLQLQLVKQLVVTIGNTITIGYIITICNIVTIRQLLQFVDTSLLTRFIPKLEESSICARWLNIEPQRGIVDPQNVMIINITVNIDNKALKSIGTDRKLDVGY